MEREKRTYLPITLDITDKKILVIGGGNSAYKKVKILLRFTNNVEVIAIDVCDEIKALGVNYKEKSYEKSDLNDYVMLYSCTNNELVDKQILTEGTEIGVLVNIHDKPAMCQYVSPAVFSKENITVAVGSNATNALESIKVRDMLAAYLNENYFEN